MWTRLKQIAKWVLKPVYVIIIMFHIVRMRIIIYIGVSGFVRRRDQLLQQDEKIVRTRHSNNITIVGFLWQSLASCVLEMSSCHVAIVSIWLASATPREPLDCCCLKASYY
jgi:hypothetical protein